MVTTRSNKDTEAGQKRQATSAPAQQTSAPKAKRARKNSDKKEEQASEEPSDNAQDDNEDATAQKQEAEQPQEQASAGSAQDGEPLKPQPQTHIADTGTKDSSILQHGRIFFLYKPKVGVDKVKSVDDTARFHVVLKPHSTQDQKPVLIIVGRKYLPNPVNGRQPIWSFVKDIGLEEAISHLGDSTYSTKTQGRRHVGEDRLIGEGSYALVKEAGEVPSKTRAFLVYALEEPVEQGEVQKAFSLEEHGAFGLSVKNPKTPSGPGQGLSEGATYPDDLQEKFEGKRWIPLIDPAFLSYPSCEMLLLMHKHELPEDYVHALEEEAKEDAKSDKEITEHPEKEAAKRLWEELKVPVGQKDEKVDVEPITGDWE